MSACGWRRPLSLRRFAPRVLRWKTLRVSSAPHPCGFESHALGTKKKGLHHWRPNNSMVGDEGCPRAASPPAPRFGPAALACCAGKRFAFPQLRTLSGSNPSAMGPNKNGPLSRTVSNSMVGDEGCPRAASPPAPRFGPAALACCAGKRFAFPQLRTLVGSNPSAMGPKRKGPHRLGAFSIKWWAMRDSNPQPCACKAPALTVAPIARRD